MARNLVNATDRITYTGMGAHNPAMGVISLRLRTTAAGANNVIYSNMSSGSRNGYFLNTYNGATAYLGVQAYPANTPTGVSLSATTPHNDGNWHHFAFCWNIALGGNNLLYHNGVLEASMAATRAWSVGNYPRLLGDPSDTFWPTFAGDVAELAEWQLVHLTADEIMSLAKGYSAKLIRPDRLAFYAPLVRDLSNRNFDSAGAATGTTVVPHPPMMGGGV